MSNPLWRDGAGLAFEEISGSAEFDLVIIGGGYSGLWSAFHLLESDPTLRIAICEQNRIGFGASGRNGGWASTEYPVSRATLNKRHGAAKVASLDEALINSLTEIEAFATAHAPKAAFVKSGTVVFARNRAQLIRLRNSEHAGEWLSRAALRERINVAGGLAGRFNPECATVQPFELLTGLANYLVSKGVRIFTETEANEAPGGVLANSYKLLAPMVVRATEVFGAPARRFIPLYSLMVATEPLPKTFWDESGNVERFTFAEFSHLVNYAQRTSDDRLAIGGRGATYPFGSKLQEAKESTARVHAHIRSLATNWFPALRDFRFTHAWGGAVAITRDWEPYVFWDRVSGRGALGGYAGDGVTMSYLAAKALAGEILDKQSEARNLHFVNRRVRNWEPEPLRYLAVNSLVKLSGISDREEAITGRPSILERVIAPVILR